jgi:hypothetical protein
MSWWNDIPSEGWAIVSLAVSGLGTQVALLIKWRREDKLRAEARELKYQDKVESLLNNALDRQEEYTKGLLAYAQSSAELKVSITRNNELLQDVAQIMKEFVRGRGQ